jgi:Caspase domain
MQVEAQKIAQALNMDYSEHVLTSANFTISKVEDAIANTSVGPDDIVLLYFSTHGAKSPRDSTIFPQLDIPAVLISSYKEHKKLAGKHPKSLLTVVEACSGYLDITPQEAFVFQQGPGSNQEQPLTPGEINNIKQLFSNACELIITAGEPGKNTWATNEGSMFTNCFLRALNEYIDMPADKTQNVTWDNVLAQAKQYTYDMTSTTSITYYPVWEKDNCGGNNGLVPQLDTSAVVERAATLSIETKKTLRLRNKYDVFLHVNYKPVGDLKIDSVTYFLDKTMTNPIVTVSNSEDNFFLSLAVWGSYPIKAKVYFNDNKQVDLYGNFNLSRRAKSEQ